MGRILLDWPIFGLGLTLSLIGLLMVYSATWRAGDSPGFYASDIFIKQSAALAVALALFYFARRVKWGLKPMSWLWFYVPVMLLLIAVLVVGHGDESHGASRWINLGFFKLQPSEPAKVAWIMLLAWLLSADPPLLARNYIRALLLMLSMVGLMFVQPDLGTSMVFVFTFFVVSFLAPVPRRLVANTLLIGVLLAIPAFFVLRTYQQNRVLELVGLQKWEVVADGERLDRRFQTTVSGAARLQPDKLHKVGDSFITKADESGVGFQASQGLIAVGSGGLTGKGFLRGTQGKGGFVPIVESDFIFALVGEEFGFIGCAVLLLLFFLLIARILALSQAAQSAYERYICYGASAVLLFHVFIAVGMVVKLMPVTGVPLPFISQGGSALLAFWLMLAVLESIYERGRGAYRRPRHRYAARLRRA